MQTQFELLNNMSSDCEGLRGAGTSAATQAAEGEWGDLGVSEKSRPKLPSERNTMRNPPKLSKAAFQEELEEHRNTASYQKRLQWARTTIVPSGIAEKVVISAESRRTIVKDLYPRILYTFSDVVCYVTNNPRYRRLILTYSYQDVADCRRGQPRPNSYISLNGLQMAMNGQSISVSGLG